MDLSHIPSPSQAQEVVIHHSANAAAVAIPVGFYIFHAPELLTGATALLGAVWYLVLIVERINSYRDRIEAERIARKKLADAQAVAAYLLDEAKKTAAEKLLKAHRKSHGKK
jgi:hypothetical protein